MQIEPVVFSRENRAPEMRRDLAAGNDIAPRVRGLLPGANALGGAPQHDRRRRRLDKVEGKRQNDRPECEDRNQDDQDSPNAGPVETTQESGDRRKRDSRSIRRSNAGSLPDLGDLVSSLGRTTSR